MELKRIKYYLVFAISLVVYFAYSGYNGKAYWESTNVKSTDDNGKGTRTGYGRRFYHK
jgi:hypothetical protein